MKNLLLTLLSLITFHKTYSQSIFSDPNTLIDDTYYSSYITAMCSVDLNNDGFKEIIVGSYYDNTIMFYKNINGNLQLSQREIIKEGNNTTSYYSFFNIEAVDLNNDNLIDLIVTESGSDSLFWYENLGNYKFGNKQIISTEIDKPIGLAIGDIDNDGNVDIIVGSENAENISLFKGVGNGSFENKLILYDTSYGVSKVELFDIDNNGFLDIVSADESGVITFSKNEEGTFSSDDIYIAGDADDGTGFDFIDINGDSFFDIVYTNNYSDNLSYKLNINGNSFSNQATHIDNSLTDPYSLIVKDFDKDGLDDIIVSTTSNDKIGWYKNNGIPFSSLTNFSDLKIITENVVNPRHFLIEDFDNNESLDIIVSSFDNSYREPSKLSLFNLNPELDSYEEIIIQSNSAAINTVQIADMDNDGFKDVIFGAKSIMINKNKGNGLFSSNYLVTDLDIGNVSDIKIDDLNNDGWLDIIALIYGELFIYKNIDGHNFELLDNINFNVVNGIKLEISDINSDNILDIVVSYNAGEYPLSKVINNGDFNFQPATYIYSSTQGYKNYDFKCIDVDNDNDIDIIVGARNENELHWLKNEGNGVFTYEKIASSVACAVMTAGDINNDGLLDIFITSSEKSYASDFIWVKRKADGSFETNKIDTQSFKSIKLGDINNDGFLDIIGTTYESYLINERIFYYIYNDNNKSFESQVTIESLGGLYSLTKNLALGDLNNDNKLDIVSSYFFINTVKYFLNSSSSNTLSNNTFNVIDNNIYPNPSSDIIYWEMDVDKIHIFNSIGQLISIKNVTNTHQLNIDFLSNGLYIIKTEKNNQLENTFKLIVK